MHHRVVETLQARQTHRLSPVRVDFGGGWLDVPRFARSGAFIVNCAISPLVSLDYWRYERNSGIGGSAAYRLLLGHDPIKAELRAGVGWQDAAVILETGMCVWSSGSRPILSLKSDGLIVKGLMALFWTGVQHNTPNLARHRRDYDLIESAGGLCAIAVRESSLPTLAKGIRTSYCAQMKEGMNSLPCFGELAKKYCGSGFGGYGLFLFATQTERDSFVKSIPQAMAVEPYALGPGESNKRQTVLTSRSFSLR